MTQSDPVTVSPGSPLPASLRLCSPGDDDWPGMYFLAANSFADFVGPDVTSRLRTLIPHNGAVVVRAGDDVVAMALYLDLRLTVPGGAVLPTAGLSFVAVAPTHRRRGLLRAMCTELHRRMADSGYPLAALHASEGGIYGRFGYGPATVLQELTIDRRFVQWHGDAPGLGPQAVRLVPPTMHQGAFEEIYERWRRRVPGGMMRPQVLWEQLLAQRPSVPGGSMKSFGLLHPDGYAIYRVDNLDPTLARVDELRALTADARGALWRALLGLDSVQRISILTHPQDPLPFLLTDPRLAKTTWRQDGLWIRIADVPSVLEARTYAADLSTVLAVCGQGRFALDIRNGRARCTPTDVPAEIDMGLDALGSLYLGVHRAATLAAANRVRAKDADIIGRFDAAFVSDVPAETAFDF
ncbi:GNAT family N-acetyltransferase [Mycobacterium camsae]|uniref:GNAT family N-acetyltransferase n=1 Tax=Mycobacterium gordonae TaxID=1778 RepID=UPI003D6637D6